MRFLMTILTACVAAGTAGAAPADKAARIEAEARARAALAWAEASMAIAPPPPAAPVVHPVYPSFPPRARPACLPGGT